MIKLLKYDFKIGFSSILYKLLVFIGLVILINIIGNQSILSVAELEEVKPDVLDYLCFIVGGPKHIPEGMLDLYVIPVLWLIIQVMIAYNIGYYAVTDLHKYGQQVLLRSDTRARWWISKVIWNAVTVLFMYGVLYGATLLTAYLSGAKWEWVLTESIAYRLCNISQDISAYPNEVRLILLVMPVVVTLTLSVAQMTLALIFSPIIGFIGSQSIVFLATIYEFRWLISNYAMLTHNKIACGSNIVYKEGIIICVGVYVVSLMVGMLYFSNCNILPKNQEI